MPSPSPSSPCSLSYLSGKSICDRWLPCAAGYLYVTLDLAGYRTGSLNEALLRKRKE
ncbi:MAG TPA: hypothetical protein VFX31_09945 [Ktedonobacterales bacterium]|nr:hypothetical protein [Ktedonobacterales bacterium]HEX5571699.1 hypothetical protein [Ktedonobacterales bacterium]